MFSKEFPTSQTTILDNKFVYIEGIKKIININESSCILISKNKTIKIEGENLKIQELTTDEIKIKGTICSISFEVKD